MSVGRCQYKLARETEAELQSKVSALTGPRLLPTRKHNNTKTTSDALAAQYPVPTCGLCCG
eukprot:1811811-Rhodomonas_salina.5